MLDEAAIQPAPPRARLGPCKFGKHAGARPHRTFEERVLGVNEVVARRARVVRRVTGRRQVLIRLHVQVGDGDGLNARGLEIVDHLGEGREGFGVDRERRIFGLVVDVEPHRVERDLVFLQVPDHAAHFLFGHVAVAALMVTERPQRRQRRSAG